MGAYGYWASSVLRSRSCRVAHPLQPITLPEKTAIKMARRKVIMRRMNGKRYLSVRGCAYRCHVCLYILYVHIWVYDYTVYAYTCMQACTHACMRVLSSSVVEFEEKRSIDYRSMKPLAIPLQLPPAHRASSPVTKGFPPRASRRSDPCGPWCAKR